MAGIAGIQRSSSRTKGRRRGAAIVLVLAVLAGAAMAALPAGAFGHTQALLISPVGLDFGDVQVGETSPTQTVDITNIGSAPVLMSGVGGAPGAPFFATQNCQGNTLQPGDSCQMFFRFEPTAAGPATATSSPTWTGQSASIELRGNGVSPSLLATPYSLDFGDVEVGATSPTQPVDITNVGNAPVVMSGVGGAPGAPFFATQNCQGNTLQPGDSCQMFFRFEPTVAGPASATSSPAWTGQPFSIDLRGRGVTDKAHPTISTQASAGGLLGTPVRDVATLQGGFGATGTVTFRLFSDDACTAEVFASTNPLVGGTTATSGWFTPTAPGTYHWTAVYSGDGHNEAATSPCGAPNESVTIAAFEAPPFTRTITGDFLGPLAVNAGESVLVTNARVVGPVTVAPGGSLTVAGSRISRGITANAPSFFSLCGTDVSGPQPAVALNVANAAVPIRVGDPAAGCAGNRFAGQVAVTANLALTFGANIVSGNATIDNHGPGNSVLKANRVFGTLGCAGNDPAPTNAGQPNTAASKTGQCAGL